ncbi:DUF3486 family protein [Dongia deserti]|uniref:DUF3486 family protein n=1 Tax=Dongia deserti TaxID=2268030 RepID=UPI000E647BE7|nr:DUF3486 family protein [Dongia deserti]
MPRPSSIMRLPGEVRELIGQLRRDGHTIDEILDKLRELKAPGAQDVSRSALGRHIQGLDKIVADIQRTRTIADAIVQRLGDAPESKTARLNIELMHGLVMKLMTGDGSDEPVKLDAQEAYFAATALQRLAQAAKVDVEREVKIRERVKAEIAERATETAKQAAGTLKKAGLSAETIATVEREILGIVR